MLSITSTRKILRMVSFLGTSQQSAISFDIGTPPYLKPDGQWTYFIQWKSPHGASSSDWTEWRWTKSGSAALIDTVRLSSAPQPLRLSSLFHQFLLKMLVKTCFGSSLPRTSTF